MMIAASPAYSVSIEHPGSGASGLQRLLDADTLARYLRYTSRNAIEVFSDAPLRETDLYEPVTLPPAWLAKIERVINDSVQVDSPTPEEEGRWLSNEVASVATEFFRQTADLLPAEPRVYSTMRGDLVAEFKAKRGDLTSIISSTFIVLYAAHGEDSLHEKLSPTEDVRGAVLRLAKPLTAPDGDLATGY